MIRHLPGALAYLASGFIASMSRLSGRSRTRPGLDRSKAAVATRDKEARRPRVGVWEASFDCGLRCSPGPSGKQTERRLAAATLPTTIAKVGSD